MKTMFIELHRDGVPTLINFNAVCEIEEFGEKTQLIFIQLADHGDQIGCFVDEPYHYVASEIKKYQTAMIAHNCNCKLAPTTR